MGAAGLAPLCDRQERGNVPMCTIYMPQRLIWSSPCLPPAPPQNKPTVRQCASRISKGRRRRESLASGKRHRLIAWHRALAALEPTPWQESVGLKSIPSLLPVPPCSCSSPPGMSFPRLTAQLGKDLPHPDAPRGKTVSKGKHAEEWNENFFQAKVSLLLQMGLL